MMPRDIRKAEEGQQVTAVFFIVSEDGHWEVFGEPQRIEPRQPFAHSQTVQGSKVRTLAGIIYWGDQPVFKAAPLMCMPGDTFTFNFEDGNGSRE